MKIASKHHTWVTYMNPRNQKIRLLACSHCGVIKGAVAKTSGCSETNDRVANMLVRQGWAEQSPSIAA